MCVRVCMQVCMCMCVYARRGDWPESTIEVYRKVIIKNKKAMKKVF